MPTRHACDLPALFKQRFGREPMLFRAPGRVNLIGEHTDYNDGFVLPAALDLVTYVAIAPRADRLINVHSLNLGSEVSFDLDGAQQPARNWSDYVRGVAAELLNSGYRLCGADVAIFSTLAMGSGLSASAALEVGFGYALLSVSSEAIDRLKLAQICQRAENEFVGMRCGIMDQFISCHGVAGAALLLDCRSLEARPIPIDPAIRIVVCNTMVHHELASSAFNQRRKECEDAVTLLSPALGGVSALRDVSLTQLHAQAGLLPALIYRRARHVVSENARVMDAVAALEARDFAAVGKLMNASHDSLRDDYNVSCRELEIMVDLSRRAPGTYGARMTGGGFGGCTVSLVSAEAAEGFADVVGPAYKEATGLTPMIFSCYPAAGAGPAHF
ncbi:galactokinase [Methylocystis echinoides]|uniref:Galactokinase n=1 Tax=Methylocystis echinoides TaxID=29468 RepID=A0A9W6LR04_9HYPH|nr:galactokinase [Methylocystis echinoides]GLI92033.1 galactokinase [Methylocystis echinoides]